MKIAQIVATFPPDIGGMGQVVFDEAAELTKRGHDVTVFCLRYPASQYTDGALPFKVVRLNSFFMSGNGGWVPGLFWKLKQFDVVHLHYPFYGGAEWVWWRKVLTQQKYVVTYHMDAAPTHWLRWIIQKFYDGIFAKAILHAARQVIFVDEVQSQQLKLRRKLSPNKITMLVNGIDTAIFQPQAVTPKDFMLEDLAGKSIFLFVGNLLPVKGLDILFKAWSKLALKNAALLVVGGGYDEDRYRRLAEQLKLGQTVRWLGPCSDRQKLARYYSLATATIIPSLSESFSLVAAEAAACGSIVIGSDIAGMRHRVIPNKTGLLFQPKDVASLAHAIEQILVLPEATRKLWGLAGRELVTTHFSLEKHVDGLEKMYQTV